MREQRIEKLRAMLEENPADIFALYAMAMEYYGLNQLEESEKYFLKVLAIDQEKVAVYYQLGKLNWQKGEEKTALNYLNTGLNLLSNSQDQKTKNEFRSLIDEIEF